ncbi:tripartite tricarboxylate transporter TctB family protein [Agrobacterium vitis]|uniref:Tripartite tricarboxylate transporter TctB family protein n=1 Tax=Agrobacterium vitis TaxID=373 RepID=A0AAE2RAQ9_AGRVI|nr:tripartite tricarboxylate transporter TctB family protein [Agrobacterium vitis]MBF2713235.1 tripartite tricarboxylate transporter TctB family protein [Agrobacterium vitis]
MSIARLAPYTLTVIGLGAAVNAANLQLWAHGEPAAGLFPFLAALLLVFTSLGCTLEKTAATEPVELTRLLAYCVALGLFCLILQVIGFALSAFLFLVTVFRLIERMDWKWSLILAFVFAFSTWGLFEGLLNVPLPRSDWRL